MKEAVEASAWLEVVLKAVLEAKVKVTAKLEAKAALRPKAPALESKVSS